MDSLSCPIRTHDIHPTHPPIIPSWPAMAPLALTVQLAMTGEKLMELELDSNETLQLGAALTAKSRMVKPRWDTKCIENMFIYIYIHIYIYYNYTHILFIYTYYIYMWLYVYNENDAMMMMMMMMMMMKRKMMEYALLLVDFHRLW